MFSLKLVRWIFWITRMYRYRNVIIYWQLLPVDVLSGFTILSIYYVLLHWLKSCCKMDPSAARMVAMASPTTLLNDFPQTTIKFYLFWSSLIVSASRYLFYFCNILIRYLVLFVHELYPLQQHINLRHQLEEVGLKSGRFFIKGGHYFGDTLLMDKNTGRSNFG